MELTGVALFAVASNAMAALFQRRGRRLRLVRVGQVESLFVYPVKSCKGISLDEVHVTVNGLETKDGRVKDRHFVVVTDEVNSEFPGSVMHQRQYPEMALVSVEIVDQGDRIRLTAPEMPALEVPIPKENANTDKLANGKLWGFEIHGLDCGLEVSAWWNKYLKRKDLRMLYSQGDRCLKEIDAVRSKVPDDRKTRVKNEDQPAYQDFGPLHLVASASVADVNDRLGNPQPPIVFNQFRPSVFIRTETAFMEDQFDVILIGRDSDFSVNNDGQVAPTSSSVVALRQIRLNPRCVLTTVDPALGKKRPDGEPLQLLKSFRMRDGYDRPVFGVDVGADRCGLIRQGDAVYATFLA